MRPAAKPVTPMSGPEHYAAVAEKVCMPCQVSHCFGCLGILLYIHRSRSAGAAQIAAQRRAASAQHLEIARTARAARSHRARAAALPPAVAAVAAVVARPMPHASPSAWTWTRRCARASPRRSRRARSSSRW